MDWYAEPWVYDTWFQGVNGDENFWPELARRTGSKAVLELGSGSGRLTIPLARALAEEGVSLVGVDLSPQMLAVAAEALTLEPPAVQAAVRLVEADMRTLQLDQRFDLAFIGFNTFGQFHNVEEQLDCFRAAHRHLVPGGRFAIEVNFYSPTHLAERLEDRPLSLQGHYKDEDTGETTLFLHSMRYHPETQISDELLRLERIDLQGQAHVSDVHLHQHLYSPRELELLFRLGGFEVESIYGDNEFGPLTQDSELQIVVGRAV